MPIRRGDGTGIESIRKGDGTQIAEVRKGDGTVLWQRDAIPDSEITQEIDFFERADVLAPYDSITNSQFISEDTTTVFEGDKSLSTTSDGFDSSELISTSGLNHYPVRGETIRGYSYGNNAAQAGVIFGDSAANFYKATVDQHDDNFIAITDESGNTIANSAATPVDSVWSVFEIEWGSPTITVRIYDENGTLLASTSGDDSSYSGGSFGFFAGGGSTNETANTCFWDLVGVK